MLENPCDDVAGGHRGLSAPPNTTDELQKDALYHLEAFGYHCFVPSPLTNKLLNAFWQADASLWTCPSVITLQCHYRWSSFTGNLLICITTKFYSSNLDWLYIHTQASTLVSRWVSKVQLACKHAPWHTQEMSPNHPRLCDCLQGGDWEQRRRSLSVPLSETSLHEGQKETISPDWSIADTWNLVHDCLGAWLRGVVVPSSAVRCQGAVLGLVLRASNGC